MSKYSIHPGTTKKYRDLKANYWWLGIKIKIAMYLAECVTCSLFKVDHHKPYDELQQPEIPEWEWDKIMMDFYTKSYKTSRGNDMIWVFHYFLRLILDRDITS